ncbi:MAG: hypothetical protein ABIE74_00725 [Pseudomonadota bacterium]
MNRKRDITLIVGLLLLISSCTSSGTGGEGGGGLSLKVTNTKAQPTTDIKEFKIIVTGEGIESPIEAVFPYGTQDGVIRDIPCGDDRHVELLAIDNSNRIVKRGESLVAVHCGKMNDASVTLKRVPIVANMIPNSIIENGRINLKIISELSDEVIIKDVVDGVETDLTNPENNAALFSLSADKGELSYEPTALSNTWHTFKLESTVTGYSSETKVRLVEEGDRKPARISFGGAGKTLANK